MKSVEWIHPEEELDENKQPIEPPPHPVLDRFGSLRTLHSHAPSAAVSSGQLEAYIAVECGGAGRFTNVIAAFQEDGAHALGGCQRARESTAALQ